MGAIFSAIKRGSTFYIDGQPFKKTSDITYEEMGSGFEHYLSPLEEAKMSTVSPTQAAAEAVTTKKKAAVDTQEFVTDPQTRIQTKNPNFGKRIKKTGVSAGAKPPVPKSVAPTKKG